MGFWTWAKMAAYLDDNEVGNEGFINFPSARWVLEEVGVIFGEEGGKDFVGRGKEAVLGSVHPREEVKFLNPKLTFQLLDTQVLTGLHIHCSYVLKFLFIYSHNTQYRRKELLTQSRKSLILQTSSSFFFQVTVLHKLACSLQAEAKATFHTFQWFHSKLQSSIWTGNCELSLGVVVVAVD